MLIFFHLVGSNPKNGALDFLFAYGYGSIIFDCILSTNFTSQVTIVCYTRYISYCRSNNNWDASQPLFFLCFISLALLSCCISEHFCFFLDNFWFWKISIKTKCLPKDWARYFLIRVFFLLLRLLLLAPLRYGLLFIFYENISCWARYMTYIKKNTWSKENLRSKWRRTWSKSNVIYDKWPDR